MSLKEDLQKWQDEELGPYCQKECKNHCCRNIFLLEHNLEAFLGKYYKEALGDLREKGQWISDDDEIRIYLRGKLPRTSEDVYFAGGTCHNYDPLTKRCEIHDHPDRPDLCKEHPIEPRTGKIEIVATCHLATHIEDYLEESVIVSLLEIAKKHDMKLIAQGRIWE